MKLYQILGFLLIEFILSALLMVSSWNDIPFSMLVLWNWYQKVEIHLLRGECLIVINRLNQEISKYLLQNFGRVVTFDSISKNLFTSYREIHYFSDIKTSFLKRLSTAYELWWLTSYRWGWTFVDVANVDSRKPSEW